jgi:hypothetical protein
MSILNVYSFLHLVETIQCLYLTNSPDVIEEKELLLICTGMSVRGLDQEDSSRTMVTREQL